MNFSILGLEIEVGTELTAVTHAYPNFEISLYPFRCTVTAGELVLAEHAQALWVSPAELQGYDWAEADVPIVREVCLILFSICIFRQTQTTNEQHLR